MKFVYKVLDNISPLAWCAKIVKNEFNSTVFLGGGIECDDAWFVEGVWDGIFSDMNFDNAIFFCGSGGKISDAGYLFATSNHVLENISVLQLENQMYISNSIAFLLSLTGEKLDSEYLDYEKDFSSITNGINEYKKEIILESGNLLKLFYYCNIIVTPTLEIRQEKKNCGNHMNTYYDYFNSLCRCMQAIADNGQSVERKRKYGIVTTVSKGYDSAACAAVAKKIGCDTAVTFNKPEKYADDCGDVVASQLGYKKVIRKNADHYLSNKKFVEAEHVCSGELGTTIIFEAFEEEFANKIVLYGERGDKIWSKNYLYPNAEFKFSGEEFAGISMTEWRLRVGFILCPMPLYRAELWKEIHEISNSEEMQEWSIGGNYDRPIARRICEDMGVDRKEFGQIKKGAGFNYKWDNLSRIGKRMSKHSFDDFRVYYQNNRRKKHISYMLKYYAESYPIYINYLSTKCRVLPKLKYRGIVRNPGAPSYLINWGMDIVIRRYKEK